MAGQCRKHRVRSKRSDAGAVSVTKDMSMHQMHVIKVAMCSPKCNGPESSTALRSPVASSCACGLLEVDMLASHKSDLLLILW